MSLNKVKSGSNMYQWVTHTHNHLAGACPHGCVYCSTQDMAQRFPGMAERYSGPPRLIEKELLVNYGTGKTIFVENCSDLFAEGIPTAWFHRVLDHCRQYRGNTYVFQTKNPGRLNLFLDGFKQSWIPSFPHHFMLGTTVESNRHYPHLGKAPRPTARMEALTKLDIAPENKFITVEPILKFDPGFFTAFLAVTDAKTIYIGADSKNHGLPEPTGPEIKALVEGLREAGKKVVLKSNLKRLYQGD